MPVSKSLLSLCALVGAAFIALQPSAVAQGVPHLTVTPSTVRTLLSANSTITADMCQPADTFCLQNAVGHSVSTGGVFYLAVDAGGNIYGVTEDAMISRLSPDGKITLLGLKYGTVRFGSLNPPVTPAAVNASLLGIAGITADLAGDVYVADGGEVPLNGKYYGTILKIDPLGVATRLTGDPAVSTTRTDGAPALTQAVRPESLFSDAAANLYFYDANTCTINEIVAATGAMRVVAGTLPSSCTASTSALVNGQAANQYSFGSISSVTVGGDGTVYLNASSTLYSVSPTGAASIVATLDSNPPASGPLGGGGDLGSVVEALTTDAMGNLFIRTVYFGSQSDDQYLIELTKATNSTPSQVIILAGPTSTRQASLSADGTPEDISIGTFYRQPVFDALGRFLYAGGSGTISFLDRHGAAVFDTSTNVSQKTLTFTNNGTGTLTGLNFGGTGHPYALSPDQAELTAENAPGAPPFTMDTTTGTCLPLFSGGSFSLAPGASCTVVIDYTPNANLPAAGSFTLYTNDPLGPVTVSLAAAAVTNNLAASLPDTLNISTTTLAPSASVSANGSFTVSANVISNLSGGTSGTETPTTPTGSLSIGVTNNATGVQTVQTAALTAGTTTGTATASASFSGLATGTYSLQAVYPGDGTSAPNFSPVQTLYVQTRLIDRTINAVVDYRFPYVGATPQFLNFASLGYSNPGPVEYQDLFAGNGTIAFTLHDPNNATVDPTSIAPLGAGKYTVLPSVANAAALGYSLTAHPATFYITPAGLTVRASAIKAVYGQYYAPSGTTVPGGGTALNIPITVYTAPPVFSTDEAASPTAPNAVSLNATVVGQSTNVATLLPAGTYSVQPTLTGNGAGNYSLTAAPSTLDIAPADLTIDASYTNVSYGQVSGINYPNSKTIVTSATTAQADVAAGTLTLGAIATGTVDGLGYLPPGHYTLTPTVAGLFAPSYSVTTHPNQLVVHPADLTLSMASYTATGSLTVNSQNLCAGCYTAPNASLLTTDPALGISLFIQGTGSTSFFNSIALGSGSSVVLGPGTYTVTAGFSVSGPRPNYSLTMHPGTLIVH